jgi:hypothetical protein
MTRAVIKTKNGLRIEIEGTVDEITKVVLDVKKKIEKMEEARSVQKAKTKAGATSFILKLKDDGFFTKPKTLVQVKEKLAENGLIYEITSLSAVLLGLVRRRELGRVKTEKGWGYVKR